MRRSCIAGRGESSKWPVFVVLILVTLILSAYRCPSLSGVQNALGQCQPGHRVGFLSTFRSKLVDASSGCQVYLTGVNWFGFESNTFAPHGLWARNWQDMLNQMAQAGFNTLRLPFTDQLFDPASKPQAINY
jgi:endoglucanase